MFAPPKMILLILLIVAAWFVMRWINRPPRSPGRYAGRPQRPAGPRTQARQQAIEAEDLVRCGVCGAYVALSAAGCGKPGCPRPR